MQPTDEKLSIVLFPHPSLRRLAKPIRKVDARLKDFVSQMFDLMYEHNGVGLAATQVALPVRLFVMNPAGKRGEGEEFVFINPVISRPRGNEEAEEGCLSLPRIHGNVIRSKTIRVTAFDIAGREINQDFKGFPARIIQHETDHLDGVIFLDRLKEGAIVECGAEIEALVTEFESQQRVGGIASNDELSANLDAWESLYC